MALNIISQDRENIFMFIPTTDAWKNVSDLKNKKFDELLKKTFSSFPTDEDVHTMHSCIESTLNKLRQMLEW